MTIVRIALAMLMPAFGLAPAQTASADPGGYNDPTFGSHCVIHRYGEGEWPPLTLWFEDPVCVEYSKRDITFDNGGALTFLLAEPSRFAVAVPVCRYWQQDHWSVQTTTGATPVITWDGSYWFDKKARKAAARLTHFRIGGESAGVGDVVQALQDSYPELAAALAVYGATVGESGMSVSLSYSLLCASRS